jgi:ribosomal protein S18 acetylase RimI-like enzyme
MNIDLQVLDEPAGWRAAAGALGPWIAEALAEAQRESTPVQQVLERIEARLSDRLTLVLVARTASESAAPNAAPNTSVSRGAHDAKILGALVCLASEEPLSGERQCEIVLLHVDTAWRHRGLARTLVAEASRRLRAHGITALLARTQHNDDARISMGERWGFIRTSECMERS